MWHMRSGTQSICAIHTESFIVCAVVTKAIQQAAQAFAVSVAVLLLLLHFPSIHFPWFVVVFVAFAHIDNMVHVCDCVFIWL